jgi:hypothetical protein
MDRHRRDQELIRMSASDVAQAAIDATFAEFGREAFHNGGSTAISIIVDLRDAGSRPDDGRPIAGQITVEVRKSEVAAPSHGDTFAFDGRTVKVSNRPWLDDEEGLVWKMWAV